MEKPGRPLKSREAVQIQTYDISRLRDEDIFNINLETGPLFMESLKNMQNCCTRGGTRQNRLPVTYCDPEHPVCVTRVEGMYRNEDVTTYFLILKSDIYNCGYCFDGDGIRIGGNWTVLKDSRVIIVGGKTGSFEVSYKESKSKNRSVKRLQDFLGREILLCALYYLKRGRDDEKVTAFKSICYHLSEASRLHPAAARVFEGFLLPRSIDDVRWLFNQWRHLCNCHRDTAVEKKDFKLDACFGISNFEMLDASLITILVENEGKRDTRRMEKLLKNKRALSLYQRRVPSTKIKTKKAKIHKNWTRDQLLEYRNKELERLITETKGNPDIWISLKEACCEADLRMKRLKIDHTDVNVREPDLSEAYDDNGFQYLLGGSGEPKDNEYMLCDPLGILP